MSTELDEPTYERLRKVRDLIRWVKDHGGECVRTFNKGSHSTWRGPTGKHFTIVGHNQGDDVSQQAIKRAVESCGGTLSKAKQREARIIMHAAEQTPQGPARVLKQERIEESARQVEAGQTTKPKADAKWECSRCHLDFVGEMPKSGMCKRCEDTVANQEPIPERPPARPIVWALVETAKTVSEEVEHELEGEAEASIADAAPTDEQEAPVADVAAPEPRGVEDVAATKTKPKRLDPKWKCDVKEGCEFETDWPPAVATHKLWHEGKHVMPAKTRKPCPKCERMTVVGAAFDKHVKYCKGNDMQKSEKQAKPKTAKKPPRAARRAPASRKVDSGCGYDEHVMNGVSPVEAFLGLVFPHGIARADIGRAFRLGKKFEQMCDETQDDAIEALKG